MGSTNIASMPESDTSPTILDPVLLVRLLNEEYRDGFEAGFRAGVAEMLARSEELLQRTVALNDLRTTAGLLRQEIGETLERGTFPHAIPIANPTQSEQV